MFTLVIAGRPNVGKSTLFNRLAGKALAIVDNTPGVTRDWREAEGALGGRSLRLIDTAGLEDRLDDLLEGRMRRQTESAIKQADAVLFLIDGRAGLTPLDEHFAGWLRRQGVPVILGVNKAENEKAVQAAVAESYALGFGQPVMLSAAHGEGLGELYAALEHLLPPEDETGADDAEEEEISEAALDALEGDENYEFADKGGEGENPLKLAIVGQPNAGKSTLLNALVGSERVMTGPEPGTTRDAIAVQWAHQGRPVRLVDTAGLRKKAKIIDPVERMAAQDSLRAIRLAQVVVLVLDATLPLEKQDLTIARHIEEEGRALVVAVNKWDAVEDKKKTLDELHERLVQSLAQLPGVPVVTLSALTGKNLDQLMKAVTDIYETWNARVSTSRLNRWLSMMESRHPAPAAQGRPNRLKYMTQVKSRPPTFALWAARPRDLPDDYRRYLTNGLREEFGLGGAPVRLLVRASKNPYKED